jgi:hypothetical protein
VALGIWSKLQSLIFGTAIGAASADAIAPVLEPVKQHANLKNPYRVLEVDQVAELRAEGALTEASAENEASRTGYGKDRLHALTLLAQAGPGVAEALTLWNHGTIDEAGFEEALRKSKVLPQFWPGLKELKQARLTPQEIALGIVRSVIRDPGLMVTTLDTSDSNVPKYEPLSVEALPEAQAGGFDKERLRGLVGSIGLPLGAVGAAQAHFRGIITEGGYNQAILEGDTRPEWAPFILDYARQILTVHEYAELHLRGWITEQEMIDGGAKHGMTEEDVRRVFLNLGRPLVSHQITTGLERGGAYGGDYSTIPEPYQTAIRQSAIRPEWASLDYANRYTYPSAFAVRGLAQSGTLNAAETEDVLLKLGWEPGFAKLVAGSWTAPTGSSSKATSETDLLTLMDGGYMTPAETLTALEALGYTPAAAQQKVDLVTARRVAGAKNTAISDLHSTFKKGDLSVAEAVTAIKQLGVPDPAPAEIVADWQVAYLAANPPP